MLAAYAAATEAADPLPGFEVGAAGKAMVEGDAWGKIVLRMPSVERETEEGAP
jgi:hypothetical protein